MPAAIGFSDAPSVHHLMPSVPPPPIPSPLRWQQHPASSPPQAVGHVPSPASRYRSLRGKSVSRTAQQKQTQTQNQPFDIFVDGQDAPPVPIPAPLSLPPRGSRSGAAAGSRPAGAELTELDQQQEIPTASSPPPPSPTPSPSPPTPTRVAAPLQPTSGNNKPAVNTTDSDAGPAASNANSDSGARIRTSSTSAPPLSSKSTVSLALQPTPCSAFSLKARLESTRQGDLARLKTINFKIIKPSATKELPAPPPKSAPSNGRPSTAVPSAVHKGRVESLRRPQTQPQPQWAQEVARLEAETDRILAEQKKRDLARLQEQLGHATPPPQKQSRRLLDRLSIFTKGGRSKSRSSASSSRDTGSDITTGANNSSASSGANSPTLTAPKTPTRGTAPGGFPSSCSPSSSSFHGSLAPEPDITMAFFDYGAAGVLSAQMDAPTSNGGERRVTVCCQSATINLPVTAETLPADIIFSTANFVTQEINPANCLLVETYAICGLERPLRKYEKVRDVMNSWDRDQQNTLVVVPHELPPDSRHLELAQVARTEEPPAGFTFHLYHASRPGKWTKRWVTLLETGQMFAAKHAEAKFTDKESVTLCHLSDFDIYRPRESEMKRYLKPPRRFCYAVKSQQKSNAFPNGENFMHFFCTDDTKLATRFHDFIHGWRSWYLANKKVDLDDTKAGDMAKRSLSVSHKSVKSPKGKNRAGADDPPRLSAEGNPYLLGDFKPLIDMERFNKPIEEFGKDLPTELQPKHQPPPSEPAKVAKKAPASGSLPTSPVVPSEGEFLSGGLLGDAYDKRKQAEGAVAPTETKKIEGPFTEGPSLLNSIMKATPPPPQKPEPPSWFPSATEHTARSRSASVPRNGLLLKRPGTADMKSAALSGDALHGLQPPSVGRPGARQPGKGRGVKPPSNGTPLIDLANGNPMPSGPVISRSTSRAVPSPSATSSTGGPNTPRRRATTSSRSGGGVYMSSDRPPVPPLPDRSVRRSDQRVVSPPTLAREQQRPVEPLIKRAK